MLDLAELERLMKEATEGPWRVETDGDWCGADSQILSGKHYVAFNRGYIGNAGKWGNDAALIVALRNNAEALIAVARAAEKVCQETHPTHRTLAVAKLRAAIQKVKEGV